MSVKISMKRKVDDTRIELEDCECGDIVKLSDGCTCLIINPSSIEDIPQSGCRAMVILCYSGGTPCMTIGNGATEDVLDKTSSIRIVEILGKLNMEVE